MAQLIDRVLHVPFEPNNNFLSFTNITLLQTGPLNKWK